MGKELATVSDERIEAKRAAQFRFVIQLIEHDLAPTELAQKLAKGNKRKAATIRRRYQRWCSDPDFIELVGRQVNGTLLLGLPRASNALVRRAAKGNVPAIKLLMEASGFWSPKTTQEHVGEIAISIRGIERPALVTDEDSTIVDADVVED